MSETPRPPGPEPISDEAGAERIEELFALAIERPPGARTAFLEEACADSPALLETVRSLVEAHEAPSVPLPALDPSRAAQLLASVHPRASAPDTSDDTTLRERTVGPYRLIREIGQGGMGTVFLAERVVGGFEQQVALKLIQRGVDSEAMLERFQLERQILARLEHPGIARLLDGGVTDDGQPYFAMEPVDGVSILDYVDQHKLSIETRLELFVQVCDAVQFAHAALIVHRDLKPSNVLVTAEGRVKLVDFGIAKVLATDRGEETGDSPATRIGFRAMTPEYASPEQILGEPVTTASDVYGLGVLLYELLTGYLPYDGPLTTPGEVVRAICETVPEPPSTVVRADRADRADRVNRVNRAGRTADDRIDLTAALLKGDLDAICLKALAKEKKDRYRSAEALAEDVHRHLAGLPVRARPPSTAYRLTKFVRRHRWGVAATGLAVVALLLGLMGTTWQAKVAAAERDRATEEAVKASEIQGFLTSLLQSVDPGQTGETWTADQLLDEGVQRIDALLPEQPTVAADLLGVMGGVSRSLGQFERAENLWRRAVALRRGTIGETRGSEIERTERTGLAFALQGLAKALYYRSDYDEVERLLHEAESLWREEAEIDPKTAHPELARTLEQLGIVMQELDRLDDAQRYHLDALDLRQAQFGTEHVDTASSISNLGGLARVRGDLDEALERLTEGLAIEQRLLGERHPTNLTTMNNLAGTLKELGRYPEAEALYRQVIEIGHEVWGENHPRNTTTINNLAHLLFTQGEFEQAVRLFEQVVALDRRQLGDEHRYVSLSLDNLAAALTELGRLDEASDHFEQAEAIMVAAAGPKSPALAASMVGYSTILRYRSERDATPIRPTDLERSLADLERARTNIREAHGPGNPREVRVIQELAELNRSVGRTAQAEALFREAIEMHGSASENLLLVQLRTGRGRNLLDSSQLDSGRFVEAQTSLDEAVRIARAILPASHPDRLDAELAKIILLRDSGDEAAAREALDALQGALEASRGFRAERLRQEAKGLSPRAN